MNTLYVDNNLTDEYAALAFAAARQANRRVRWLGLALAVQTAWLVFGR